MCGIAGVISKTNSLSIKEKVFAMSQSIKHRGPDGEGFMAFNGEKVTPLYSEETPLVNKQSNHFKFNPNESIDSIQPNHRLAFAHRRLSIIDLSESGHQPMCDTSGDYWITFNGEVYNYIELREELKLKGHTFLTQTDTEVVVAAYKEWGVKCLERFNGMWAFALLDKKNNQLFCARDRVGVKPFYYVNTNEVFAFASEYKAFIKSGLVKFEVNEEAQYDYLINATLETKEQSLFKNITELKPAHYFLYDLKSHQFDIKPYYTILLNAINQKSDKELIDVIEEKVVNAIKLRLRSDVEIGSCLSGGLDSSIIAGVIKYLQPEHSLKLFTAVFPGEKFDETNYAQLMANSIQGNWQTVSPSAEEFFRDIETLNYYQDLPVWSTSTYSQHRVMQLAKENNIKVVLDGQGADELFAGYVHHYYSYWKETLGLSTFKKLNDSKPTIPNPYAFFFKEQAKEKLGVKQNYSEYFINKTSKLVNSSAQQFADSLNQQLKEDYLGRLKSFLKCEDRCSMAFGIESRVPFADDVELVDFAFSIDGKKKIQQGISKYLLREATKNYLPEKIYSRRDKIGFEAPVSDWLIKFKPQVLDTISQLSDEISLEYIYFNFSKLVLNKPNFLLRIYSLAIWKKVYK